MKFKTNTYLFPVLIKGVKLKELVFLLIIIVGTHKNDNEDCQKDRETLNPS
jgi:hypothetical protein